MITFSGELIEGLGRGIQRNTGRPRASLLGEGVFKRCFGGVRLESIDFLFVTLISITVS